MSLSGPTHTLLPCNALCVCLCVCRGFFFQTDTQEVERCIRERAERERINISAEPWLADPFRRFLAACAGPFSMRPSGEQPIQHAVRGCCECLTSTQEAWYDSHPSGVVRDDVNRPKLGKACILCRLKIRRPPLSCSPRCFHAVTVSYWTSPLPCRLPSHPSLRPRYAYPLLRRPCGARAPERVAHKRHCICWQVELRSRRYLRMCLAVLCYAGCDPEDPVALRTKEFALRWLNSTWSNHASQSGMPQVCSRKPYAASRTRFVAHPADVMLALLPQPHSSASGHVVASESDVPVGLDAPEDAKNSDDEAEADEAKGSDAAEPSPADLQASLVAGAASSTVRAELRAIVRRSSMMLVSALEGLEWVHACLDNLVDPFHPTSSRPSVDDQTSMPADAQLQHAATAARASLPAAFQVWNGVCLQVYDGETVVVDAEAADIASYVFSAPPPCGVLSQCVSMARPGDTSSQSRLLDRPDACNALWGLLLRMLRCVVSVTRGRRAASHALWLNLDAQLRRVSLPKSRQETYVAEQAEVVKMAHVNVALFTQVCEAVGFIDVMHSVKEFLHDSLLEQPFLRSGVVDITLMEVQWSRGCAHTWTEVAHVVLLVC